MLYALTLVLVFGATLDTELSRFLEGTCYVSLSKSPLGASSVYFSCLLLTIGLGGRYGCFLGATLS